MSTQKTKRDNLPPLQKRIILYLAKHEPQTINETVKGIRSCQYKSSYKSSWTAFNSLEKKGLIKKTDVKTYRGREYPRFWLSSAGVFVALVEGASAQDLLEKTIKAYPNDKVLQCCLELAPFTGIEGYRVALSAILSKGKFEQSDATIMMLTQMEKDLSIKQFKQFLEVLKRYPKEYEKMKKQVEQFNESLDKIEEMI
jgi:hypothetical protein